MIGFIVASILYDEKIISLRAVNMCIFVLSALEGVLYAALLLVLIKR